MKLKPTFITHDMKDEQILVDVTGSFCGVIRSNETAAFIVNCFREDTDIDAAAAKLMSEYDVDGATARRDVEEIVEKLRSTGAFEE